MSGFRATRSARIVTASIPLALWALAGCAPGVASPSPAGLQAAPALIPTSTPAAHSAPADALPSPMPAGPEATPEPARPTPTVRSGLQATDPGSVVLASGRPQLVEFFAFW